MQAVLPVSLQINTNMINVQKHIECKLLLTQCLKNLGLMDQIKQIISIKDNNDYLSSKQKQYEKQHYIQAALILEQLKNDTSFNTDKYVAQMVQQLTDDTEKCNVLVTSSSNSSLKNMTNEQICKFIIQTIRSCQQLQDQIKNYKASIGKLESMIESLQSKRYKLFHYRMNLYCAYSSFLSLLQALKLILENQKQIQRYNDLQITYQQKLISLIPYQKFLPLKWKQCLPHIYSVQSSNVDLIMDIYALHIQYDAMEQLIQTKKYKEFLTRCHDFNAAVHKLFAHIIQYLFNSSQTLQATTSLKTTSNENKQDNDLFAVLEQYVHIDPLPCLYYYEKYLMNVGCLSTKIMSYVEQQNETLQRKLQETSD